MNKSYLWNLNSWGSGEAPENANEIIDHANELIDAYAETHDDQEVYDYSAKLWNTFCATDTLPGMKPNAKFIVEDLRTTDGDVTAEFYDTLEEANAAADKLWRHLLPKERKHRVVTVALVKMSDLADDAFDEDDGIDWNAYTSYHVAYGAWTMPEEEMTMETNRYNYYSYDELVKKALVYNAEQIDIDTLGDWFAHHGTAYWNGECYDIDGTHRVFPVYSDPDEYGDSEIIGYEIR